MRQIVLDTETTGLSVENGDRIIEFGAIELIDRKLTERRLHFYINPDREVHAEAVKVHGLNNDFLADKPRFHELAEEIVSFIKGAELIIHNAEFDLGFLDYELSLLRRNVHGSVREHCSVIDTLALARKLHPGQRNSLDALCKRYTVKNSHRKLHGALLDAEILAELYLLMTGGQEQLFVEAKPEVVAEQLVRVHKEFQAELKIVRAKADELAADQAYFGET